jgi:predicted LPLAT superfamily acyltransferase
MAERFVSRSFYGPACPATGSPSILNNLLMTPAVLIAAAAALIVLVLVVRAMHRRARLARNRRAFDVGAVSSRWLSELRRDEPWTPS